VYVEGEVSNDTTLRVPLRRITVGSISGPNSIGSMIANDVVTPGATGWRMIVPDHSTDDVFLEDRRIGLDRILLILYLCLP